MWGDANAVVLVTGIISVVSCVGLILAERRRVSQFQNRAERITAGIESLKSERKSIVSISSNEDGYEVVSVVAPWTDYLDHSFFNVSLEGAIEDALSHREKVRMKENR